MTPARAPSEERVCAWAGHDPLMRRYHDAEWGVPVHDDRRLFEFLTLEGAQAGLSWSTILGKRESYREAFAAFDPARQQAACQILRALGAKTQVILFISNPALKAAGDAEAELK